MPDDNKPSRSKLGIAITSVLAAGTLIAGSLVGQNTNAVSLEPKAQAALQQAGISGVTVTMQGREAYLSGPGLSQDQLAAAKVAVEKVYGVRWAKVKLDSSGQPGAPAPETSTPAASSPEASSPAPSSSEASSPAPSTSEASSPAPSETSASPSQNAPVVKPQVNIQGSPSGTIIDGTVATQAEADALAAAAEKAFGGPVINKIVVDPKCEKAPWVNELANAMAGFPKISGNASLKAGNGGITISGDVASEADLAVITAAAKTISVPTNVNIQVSAPGKVALTDAEKAQINAVVVNFATGVYTLDATAKAKLDAIVPLLAKSDVKLVVNGYVSLPNPEDTLISSSKARAQAVVDYLVSRGIESTRFTAVGKGAADPVGDNNTDAGRYQNQRATLTVA